MSHKSVRLLIEDTVKSLADNITFDFGRQSDTNMIRDIKYPLVSCNPLNSSASFAVNNVTNYSKTYQVQMAFVQLDKEASSQDEYSLLLDEMNDLADSFIVKLNFNSHSECITDGDIIITGISTQPFIKAMKDCVTGCLLNFSLQVTDDFNYCAVVC